LAILAKTGGADALGSFALALAITAPVFLFTNLTLRTVQAADVNDQFTFGDFLCLRLFTTVMALGVIGTGVCLAGHPLTSGAVVLLVAVAKGIEAIGDVFYGLFQKHQCMGHIARSMIARGLLSLVALGTGLAYSGSILWGLLGMILAWALVLVLHEVWAAGALLRARRDSLPRSGRPLSKMAGLAWLALPLGIAAVLNSVSVNVPRYWLAAFCGERELGIFAALASLTVPGNVLACSLAESALPKLSVYVVAGDKVAFRKLVLRLAATGFLLGIAAVLLVALAGRNLLRNLYTPECSVHVNVCVVLTAGSGFGFITWFLDGALTAARLYVWQALITTAMLLTVAAGCCLAVPRLGLMGAAIAWSVALFVQMVFKGIVVWSFPRRQVSQRGDGLMALGLRRVFRFLPLALPATRNSHA
jgi:O-antigen/teichoic acid export membrane protein